MRIAVVGGKGTLGKYVVAALAERGHETRVLSRSGEYQVDLSTGEGLTKALDGCDAVVDASNANKKAAEVLVGGSRRLLAAEQEAGIGHHVCVSIVGCDQVPAGYYKVKTQQEHVIEQALVPWSIVRATQFHELATAALAAVGKWHVIPLPAMRLQTIAAAEVGQALATVAEGEPLRARIDVAGPEVRTAAELASIWQEVTGTKAVHLPLPVPGKLGSAMRSGALTAPQPDITGTITFTDWLTARAGSNKE